MSTTELWCAVVEHNFESVSGSAFYVKIPINASVCNLQEMIKQKKSNLLNKVDSDELRVWILRNPKPGKQIKSKEYLMSLTRLDNAPEDDGETMNDSAWLIEPDEKLSSHFSEPADGICVLVQLPAPAKGMSSGIISNGPYLKRQKSNQSVIDLL